jgi:hypothetical protein
LKCDKLPSTSFGFFGVSKVVETLILPAVPQTTSGWQSGGYAVKANLTFREEYGSPPTVATGTTTGSVIAWQAAFRQQNYNTAIAAPTTYYAATVNSDAVPLKVVSNRPVSSTLTSGSNDFLSMVVDSAVTGVALRVTYDSGATRPTFLVTGTISGLAPLINAGPRGLYNLTAGQCTDGSAGSVNFPTQGGTIEVQIAANAAGTLTSAFSRTKAYTYTIDNCERYDQLRVFFRNMYGGVDGYTFTKKNRQSVNVKRQTYGYNNSVYGDDQFDKQWSVTYRDTYNLQSDWLSDAEFSWLQEMVYSPECWIELSGALVPVVVQTNTFAIMKRINDRLQAITVDVQVGYENTAL